MHISLSVVTPLSYIQHNLLTSLRAKLHTRGLYLEKMSVTETDETTSVVTVAAVVHLRDIGGVRAPSLTNAEVTAIAQEAINE